MPRSLELDEKAAYSADDANDVELDSLLPPAISEPSSSLAHHGGAVAQNAGSATTSKARKNSRSTPVPLLQISFIMIYKMAQPLSFAVIMPFINSMLVEELKVADEVHVGHYSGFVETANAIGMVLGVCICARLSDIYGRKWVTLVGVFFGALFTALFGFGTAYWQLVAMRFLTGFSNGAQAATARVMISEMSDGTNMAKCFALTGLGWQIGATIAPAIGGIFAQPAKTWPFLFKDTTFERYPYALPGVISGVVPGVTVFFAAYLQHETHPQFRSSPLLTPALRPDLKAKQSDAIAKVQKSVWRQIGDMVIGENVGLPPLFSCGEGFILVIWFLVVFQIVSLSVTELLLFFSSGSIGGLGLTQSQMSVALSIRPLLIAFYEINIYPKLSRRYGPELVLRGLICIPPFTCIIYLLLSVAASNGTLTSFLTIVGVGCALLVQMAANPMFLSCDMLIPSRSPTSQQLSNVNAISEIVAQAAVALGASAGSSVFAWSAEATDPFCRGKMVWIALFAVMALTAVITQKLTHIDGWREKEQAEERKDAYELDAAV